MQDMNLVRCINLPFKLFWKIQLHPWLDLKIVRGYQFEYHKSQSYQRLTWSLISGAVGLVKVRANWPGHPC